MTAPMEHTIIPIAIREDLIVRIQGVPFDLNSQEAAKIAAVVMAMATTVDMSSQIAQKHGIQRDFAVASSVATKEK